MIYARALSVWKLKREYIPDEVNTGNVKELKERLWKMRRMTLRGIFKGSNLDQILIEMIIIFKILTISILIFID